MNDWPVYASIDGPIVMIGFGSIGRGMLPLIERHFRYDKTRFVVIAPDDRDRTLLDERGIAFVHVGLTPDNYRDTLTPLLTAGNGTGFCVNLSVDTSSLEIMRLCRELRVPYIDTVVEPWPGFYFDHTVDPVSRTNHSLRQPVRDEKTANPGGTTAVSCCGANPGMVSWFVKQALVDIARDTGLTDFAEPPADDQPGWARLARDLGVKGIHIAERDTQRAATPKPLETFVNTWSVDGFLSAGLQPAVGVAPRWRIASAKKITARKLGPRPWKRAWKRIVPVAARSIVLGRKRYQIGR